MLVVERRAPEVNELYVCPLDTPRVFSLENDTLFLDPLQRNKRKQSGAQFRYLFTIVDRLVVGVNEEYIFRLEVRVREFVVVQEFDGVTELVTHVSDVVQGVWLVIVVPLRKIAIVNVAQVPKYREKKTNNSRYCVRGEAIITKKSKTLKPSISKAMHMWPR